MSPTGALWLWAVVALAAAITAASASADDPYVYESDE